MPKYTVAHSPDADDIFMYYAIKFGWVGKKDVQFSNIGLDIETLNEEALKNTYDASAISFALYPKIKDEYALLKTAASFGQGYGPKLIKKKGVNLKRNFTVALSGQHTTNAMLFKMKYPDARIIYKNFMEIEQAVLDDEVQAGVLIHESILDYSENLEVEAEIWDIWMDFAKDELPLPLGGMGIRRSLPLNRAIEVEEILTKAVDVAVKNSKILGKMLVDRELVRVDENMLETYLKMYANDTSITLSEIQIKALNRLYEIGFEKGYYSQIIKAEDYFVPNEYKEIRNS